MGENKIEVRGLTWGEKKKLKEEGFDFRTLDIEKDNDEFVEKVVRMGAIDLKELDDALIGDIYDAFWEITAKTFPQKQSGKNSDGRESSPPTEISGDVKPVAETG